MTDNADPKLPAYPLPENRTFFGSSGCMAIIVVAITILAAIAMWMPVSVPCTEAARRIQCTNRLKQIGLALHGYSCKYGCFPPAYTVDKQGHRMHSWRVLILKFLEPDLYAKYDFTRPWNSPENLAFAKSMTSDGPYCCPTQEPKEPSWTSYVMPIGPRAISDGPHGRECKKITDGLSNTVSVLEMSPSGILWTSPYDVDVAEMNFRPGDTDHPGLRGHAGGANVLMAEGAVRFLTDAEAEKLLKAMLTVNGREDISKLDKN
jgi:hypothetical protein